MIQQLVDPAQAWIGSFLCLTLLQVNFELKSIKATFSLFVFSFAALY